MAVDHGGRGSGRTSAQLRALPDGAIFLVAHRPMADYCRALLRHLGRDPRSITFVTAGLSRAAMFGRRVGCWGVDHAYLDVAGPRGIEAYDTLWRAAGKGPHSAE